MARISSILDAAPGTSTLTTPGFVYFMLAATTGLVKIGWATKPYVRLHNLQTMCPDKLKIVAMKAGSGRDEQAFHRQFAEYRQHGEWFLPAADILALIQEIGMPAPPPPALVQLGPPYNPHDDGAMRRMRIVAQALG